MNTNELPPVSASRASEAKHSYGASVHILNNPFLLTLLSRVGSAATKGPEVAELIRTIYTVMLAEVVSRELPVVNASNPTRMFAKTPHGIYRGPTLSRETSVVIACVIRAGMIPSQTSFELLAKVLDP